MNTHTHTLRLGLILLAGAVSFQSALAHSAVNPVPRQDQWWQDRHKLINQRAHEAGRNAQVIFIGDSITQGWEGAGREVWQKRYASLNAVNLGIGGDRTQHVLWRLQNGNLEGINPKVAVLMIGTNNSNGEDNSASQIADGVRAIVKQLRSSLPDTHILLTAIFPRGENINNQRGKILQVNQVIRKLADGDKVHWIDFGHRFVDDNGLIPADIMPDFLHLTPKGYEIWADSIQGKLDELLKQDASSGDTAGISGEWEWTMETPDGTATAPLFLEVSGNRISGRFSGGPDRWLKIEEGKLDGDSFTWIVNRDRAEGGTMTYHMSGTIRNGLIDGEATGQFEGNEVTTTWTARKK